MQEEGSSDLGIFLYDHVQLDKISKEAAKKKIEATNRKSLKSQVCTSAWLKRLP